MNFNPNSNKHKKPTRSQVKALLDLYAGVSKAIVPKSVVKKQEGAQLKFDF